MGTGEDKASNSSYEAYCDISDHVIQHRTVKCRITTQKKMEIVG